MPVLDANVIVRFLTNDHAEHSPRSYALFERLEAGEERVFLPEGVLAEVIYVLMSPKMHGLSREDICERLNRVLLLPAIEMTNKTTHFEALDLFARFRRLSYLDAVCMAHAQRLGDGTVISFDRGYRHIDNVTRVEP